MIDNTQPRRTDGRCFGWSTIAAGVLVAIGTVPPTVLAVHIYALRADYRWAINGPGLFGQSGGRPWTVAALIFVTVFAAASWLASSALATRVPHE